MPKRSVTSLVLCFRFSYFFAKEFNAEQQFFYPFSKVIAELLAFVLLPGVSWIKTKSRGYHEKKLKLEKRDFKDKDSLLFLLTKQFL